MPPVIRIKARAGELVGDALRTLVSRSHNLCAVAVVTICEHPSHTSCKPSRIIVMYDPQVAGPMKQALQTALNCNPWKCKAAMRS